MIGRVTQITHLAIPHAVHTVHSTVTNGILVQLEYKAYVRGTILCCVGKLKPSAGWGYNSINTMFQHVCYYNQSQIKSLNSNSLRKYPDSISKVPPEHVWAIPFNTHTCICTVPLR